MTDYKNSFNDIDISVENIINYNPYAIVIFNKNGNVIKYNKAYLDIFKVPAPPDYSFFNDPILIKNGFDDKIKLVQKGEIIEFPVIEYNTRNHGKEFPDNPVYIKSVMFPIFNKYNKINYYVNMFENVTEKHIADKKLAEYKNNLEKLVNQRTYELKNTNKKLSNANKKLKSIDLLKNNILSNISHEFRTPLVAIQGYTELIFNETAGSINSMQKEYLNTIFNNIDKLILLLEDLLNLSKLELNNENLEKTNFSINKLILESINITKKNADTKNIKITFNNDNPENNIINGDYTKLLMVFNNLLNNAIKFTDSNGKIVIILNKEKKNFRISISDTGIGISEKYINKIFDTFYQIDSSSNRKFSGTGIGLAICKKIIDLHNGKIECSSKKNKGSTFTITLPV